MISSTLKSSKSSNTALKTSKHSGKNNGLQASLNNGNVQSVHAMITSFIKRNPANNFHMSHNKHLIPTVNIFVRELYDRVQYPFKIDQGKAYLCGPAAFLYCLVIRSPSAYVKYMLDLWEFGEAKIGGIHIRPSNECRSFDTSGFKITAIDWMALASLRDTTNLVASFKQPKSGFAGITWPHDMVNWFKSANFSNVNYNLKFVSTNNIKSLYKANKSISKFTNVILLINASIQTRTSSKGKNHFALPNHWVILEREIVVDGVQLSSIPEEKIESYLSKKIEIFLTHWGDKKYAWHNINIKSPLTLGQFLNTYYGFIAIS